MCRAGIFNGDDIHLGRVLEGHTCTVETFGLRPSNDLYAEKISLISRPGYLGTGFDVKGTMEFHAETDIPGKFSVYNALCAIAICRHFGVEEEQLKKALSEVKVRGRVEMVKVSDDFIFLIDYAHNAMALESILTTLREYHPARLVAVFGCGGNRARSRRYEMGEVSGRCADYTIITSDNPRYENPEAIMDDIETGIRRTNGKYIRITDRKEAIRAAIRGGKTGDVIVLAGKGHEDYQEICGKKYPMDERVLIAEILEEEKKGI
jgi:UDP-N-acetylmuramoyl-L-alanyl-D-glutamate--2,6-diaminopimelate ligase